MTQPPFKITPKQREAIRSIGSDAKHVLLYGGSRSGKTFLFIRAICIRALASAHSRHAVLRFRFNHVKQSVCLDTFPKVMRVCFPEIPYKLDHTDWYAQFPNGSQIWFGGLDDKERTEKILGQEYATIFLNETSQIPFQSRNMAVTRLAQKCYHEIHGKPEQLRLKMYYDENPPSQAHWSYRLFLKKVDPDGGRPLLDPENYASLRVNPEDNMDNLPADYLATLQSLPARMRVRFLKGEFADVTQGALWHAEGIDKWRVIDGSLPDMQRIVIGVDPSGSDDVENAGNDEIGICVCGLGTDGNGYVLEDLSLKAGPKTWGNVVTSAFDRHAADKVVGEVNYGGAMVNFVIQTTRPRTPFEAVTASRGKVVRAEPISSLAEQGKIRMAGNFQQLEEELCSFTQNGYVGTDSPNRADAMIWAMTELFPGIVRKAFKEQTSPREIVDVESANQGWLAA